MNKNINENIITEKIIEKLEQEHNNLEQESIEDENIIIDEIEEISHPKVLQLQKNILKKKDRTIHILKQKVNDLEEIVKYQKQFFECHYYYKKQKDKLISKDFLNYGKTQKVIEKMGIYESLEKENIECKLLMKEKSEKIEYLKKENQELRRQLKDEIVSKKKIERKNDTIKADNIKINKNITVLKKDNENLKKSIESFKTELEKVGNVHNSKLNRFRNEYRNYVKKTENELGILKKAIVVLLTQLKNLEKIGLLEKDFFQNEDKMNKLQNSFKLMTFEFHKLMKMKILLPSKQHIPKRSTELKDVEKDDEEDLLRNIEKLKEIKSSANNNMNKKKEDFVKSKKRKSNETTVTKKIGKIQFEEKKNEKKQKKQKKKSKKKNTKYI